MECGRYILLQRPYLVPQPLQHPLSQSYVRSLAASEEFPLPPDCLCCIHIRSVLDCFEGLADPAFNFIAEFDVVGQHLFDSLTPLGEPGVIVTEP